jgi:uncharacterized protein (TIGR02391 family)
MTDSVQENVKRILKALIDNLDEDSNELSRTEIKQLTGLSSEQINSAVLFLFERGHVETSYITANGVKSKEFHSVGLLSSGVYEYAKQFVESEIKKHIGLDFEQLLHPIIKESSYQQFRNGHLREAVLNAITAVFEQIRERTQLDLDGDKLATSVFSPEEPRLIFSNLETKSGKSVQIGFMQLLQGAYKGIRNPQAHTTKHELNEIKAAQCLIFASLLAQSVADSKYANS